MPGFRLKGSHGIVQVDQNYACPALVWKSRVATDTGGPSVFDPGAAQNDLHPTSRRELTISSLTAGPYSIAISAVGSARACLPVATETSGGLKLIVYMDAPVGAQVDIFVFGPPPPVTATSGFRVRNPATKQIVFHSGLQYMRIVDDQSYNATLGQSATFANLDPARTYAAVQGLAAFGWHYYPTAGGFGQGAGSVSLIQGGVPQLSGAASYSVTTMTFSSVPAGNTGVEAADGNTGRFFLLDVTGF